MRLQTTQHHTLQAHGQRADCNEEMGNFTQVFGASPKKHKTRSGPLKGVAWGVLMVFRYTKPSKQYPLGAPRVGFLSQTFRCLHVSQVSLSRT